MKVRERETTTQGIGARRVAMERVRELAEGEKPHRNAEVVPDETETHGWRVVEGE